MTGVVLILVAWFLATCAGTALAALIVAGGSRKVAPSPDPIPREARRKTS